MQTKMRFCEYHEFHACVTLLIFHRKKTILTSNTETTKLTLYVQCTSFAGHTIFGTIVQKIRERARIVTHCDSTRPPASGAGNVNQPRLMSQVGRVVQVLT